MRNQSRRDSISTAWFRLYLDPNGSQWIVSRSAGVLQFQFRRGFARLDVFAQRVGIEIGLHRAATLIIRISFIHASDVCTVAGISWDRGTAAPKW